MMVTSTPLVLELCCYLQVVLSLILFTQALTARLFVVTSVAPGGVAKGTITAVSGQGVGFRIPKGVGHWV